MRATCPYVATLPHTHKPHHGEHLVRERSITRPLGQCASARCSGAKALPRNPMGTGTQSSPSRRRACTRSRHKGWGQKQNGRLKCWDPPLVAGEPTAGRVREGGYSLDLPLISRWKPPDSRRNPHRRSASRRGPRALPFRPLPHVGGRAFPRVSPFDLLSFDLSLAQCGALRAERWLGRRVVQHLAREDGGRNAVSGGFVLWAPWHPPQPCYT